MSGSDGSGRVLPGDERDWVVAKALIDASHRSIDALEEHARYALYHRDGPDESELRRRLETTRRQHERIIADIDAALEALADPEGDSEPDTNDSSDADTGPTGEVGFDRVNREEDDHRS